VLNLAEAFEGQFLLVEAKPQDLDPPNPGVPFASGGDALAGKVAAFSHRSHEKMAGWQRRIDALRQSGRKAVLWGAGSKGISFLNMLHVEGEIEYVVDINPRKEGKYVTGTGQQIVRPDFLPGYHPDAVIVMNPIYRQEIEGMLSQLGLSVETWLAS
jgi:hypothetical protein